MYTMLVGLAGNVYMYICTVYMQYFWQGNRQINGHVWCVCVCIYGFGQPDLQIVR